MSLHGITRVSCVAFFLIAASVGCAGSQNVPVANPNSNGSANSGQTIAGQINSLVQSYIAAGNFPGVVVGAARNGQLLFLQGYGLRDVAANLPVQADTRFAIGSITKHFTVASLLWLTEHQTSVLPAYQPFSIDDPLSKYVPSYTQAPQMTIRQIIYQIAGIPGDDYQNLYNQIFPNSGLSPVTMTQVISGLNTVGLIAAPGTVWEYSNPGYYLLGLVVQIASGAASYADFVNQHVFGPLGMSSATFLPPSGSNTAVGYTRFSYAAPYQHCTDLDASWADAPGGIVSNASDLLHWDYVLRTGGFINAADFALMLTPGKLSNGTLTGPISNGVLVPVAMALGVLPVGYGAEGGLLGYQAETLSFSDGIDVVALANSPYISDVKPALVTQVHNILNPAQQFPVPQIPPPIDFGGPLPTQFCSPIS